VAPLSVEPAAAGTRLDRWLTGRFPDLSRERLKRLIVGGHVRVNGMTGTPAHRVRAGDSIEVEVPPPTPEELVPEPGELAIVYEDEHVLVLDKPAGLVVHPGAGHARGTLAAAVLAHAPGIAGVGGPRRPGIVHRLDKDTSGLLVVAKTQIAYEALVDQLARRTVTRRYEALVHGRVRADEGVIDKPIGRHPHDRVRMAVLPAGRGKRAVTRYRVLERFRHFTLLQASLETGRTHQIRVHLASLGHPVAGDVAYRGRQRDPLPVPFEGLALHAERLAFVHPVTGRPMDFSSPRPPRMERLLAGVRDA
jgi:23S rRNA pseudouridine1911/1915/1917 synthase